MSEGERDHHTQKYVQGKKLLEEMLCVLHAHFCFCFFVFLIDGTVKARRCKTGGGGGFLLLTCRLGMPVDKQSFWQNKKGISVVCVCTNTSSPAYRNASENFQLFFIQFSIHTGTRALPALFTVGCSTF